jgi:hypothetical protein
MKNAVTSSFLLLWLICAFSGCAYTAFVKGIAGSDMQPSIPDGALICVAVDPEAVDAESSEEITDKLEMLLSRKGYNPSTSSDAEYFLFFDFGRKPLITRVGLRPLGGVRSGIQTYGKQGPFDLTLALRLIEASSYHEKGLEDFVWAGAAIIDNTPTESNKFADLLLVAAMKYFPKETAEVQKVKIGLYDFRARRLRQ